MDIARKLLEIYKIEATPEQAFAIEYILKHKEVPKKDLMELLKAEEGLDTAEAGRVLKVLRDKGLIAESGKNLYLAPQAMKKLVKTVAKEEIDELGDEAKQAWEDLQKSTKRFLGKVDKKTKPVRDRLGRKVSDFFTEAADLFNPDKE